MDLPLVVNPAPSWNARWLLALCHACRNWSTRYGPVDALYYPAPRGVNSRRASSDPDFAPWILISPRIQRDRSFKAPFRLRGRCESACVTDIRAAAGAQRHRNFPAAGVVTHGREPTPRTRRDAEGRVISSRSDRRDSVARYAGATLPIYFCISTHQCIAPIAKLTTCCIVVNTLAHQLVNAARTNG